MDRKQEDLKQRKRKPACKPEKRWVVMFSNKTNADGVSLHQSPQTLDDEQYIWLFHCNILQTFVFDHIYFLAKDVFFLPPHWLTVSTLTPRNKKSVK